MLQHHRLVLAAAIAVVRAMAALACGQRSLEIGDTVLLYVNEPAGYVYSELSR